MSRPPYGELATTYVGGGDAATATYDTHQDREMVVTPDRAHADFQGTSETLCHSLFPSSRSRQPKSDPTPSGGIFCAGSPCRHQGLPSWPLGGQRSKPQRTARRTTGVASSRARLAVGGRCSAAAASLDPQRQALAYAATLHFEGTPGLPKTIQGPPRDTAQGLLFAPPG